MFFKLKPNKIINKSSIQKIYNFIPVIKTLKLATKDTLAIFDVDDVLIMPSSDDNLKHPYRVQLWEEIKNRSTSEKIEILQSSIIASTNRDLVESRIVNMFTYLQSQDIPTIALTAMGTGKFGIIKKLEDMRITELNNLGISFLPTTPLKGEELAVELKNSTVIFPDCTGMPMLKSGIVLTAGLDKAVVLEYMFRKYNYYPKTIIFVDDTFKNLESLEQLCVKLKIDFYGFHYVAVSFMPLPELDENLEKLRFKILEQECSWFSYKKLINKKHLKYR